MKEDKIPNFDSYLLIIGFLIRLILTPLTRDPWDMDTWISIGSAIYSRQNPYALPSNALVYPPLWAIFCTTSYLSYTLTKNPLLQYFTIKLPIITADILISLTIRKIVYNLTNDATKTRTAMLLYLLNPVTIIISSLWGMFDAIPTLFALLSMLYLLQGKYLKSSLALGVGMGFKGFFPALLLPFFLLYLWKKERKPYDCFRYTAYSFFIPLIISTPFLIIDANAYITALFFPTQRFPQGLTYWFLIREIFNLNRISNTTLTAISSLFFILSFPTIYFLMLRNFNIRLVNENPNNQRFILEGTLLVLLIFYITSSVVNEQYLVWVLPFIILYATIYDQTLNPLIYTLFSLNIFFIILNVGPNFFSPITETPIWWTNFQYSPSSIILMVLIGTLFSIICLMILLKINKH